MGIKDALNDGKREFEYEELDQDESLQETSEREMIEVKNPETGSVKMIKKPKSNGGEEEDEDSSSEFQIDKVMPENMEEETGCEVWIQYDSGTRLHVEMEEIEVEP